MNDYGILNILRAFGILFGWVAQDVEIPSPGPRSQLLKVRLGR